jgi:hypothetical protein
MAEAMEARSSVVALAIGLALGGCEVDQRMSDRDARATLKKAFGYEPSSGRVIYAWRHCCATAPAVGLIPASRCVVYELSEQERKAVEMRRLTNTGWTRVEAPGSCWGPGHMKGCKGYLPGGLSLKLHTDDCSGPEGWQLQVDEAKGIGVLETYSYD